MPYRKKIYRMIDTIDVEKSFTGRYGAPGQKREKKHKATPEDIERQNRWNSIKKLTRKINANFTTGDHHVILTYRKENRLSVEQSKKAIKKFLRVMRGAYKKVGLPFKWILTTEYENKAIHHHIILNDGFEHGMNTMRLVQELWEYGRPKETPLDDTGDYKDLAAYFVKETARTNKEKSKPSYQCSRNLVTPEPEIEVVSAKTFSKNPKPFQGYYIDKDSLIEGINPVTGFLYQHYTMIRIKNPKKKKGGG